MDIEKLRIIHPTIDRCVVSLEHSSRETGFYWLYCIVSLFTQDRRQKMLMLGPGTRQESGELFKRIESFGFYQAGSRLDQEWEVVTFLRITKEE